ncbi:helix-turn-helix domain-containing protein [Saccharopolyspora shandongensis]|uniref:helix-turn-helix domain-containing protein n=1 Tax=Saccharopolyspora shandongensis TaxID=418495 RepID=UPI0033CC7489
MSPVNDNGADPVDPQYLGKRLRAARMKQRRTLKSVAGAAEISVSYLSAVEKGRNVPSLPILLRIADGLGVPPADPAGRAPSRPLPSDARRDVVSRGHRLGTREHGPPDRGSARSAR